MSQVIRVKIDDDWYEGLGVLAKRSEGTIHQQARLSIRERLEREGMMKETSTTTNKKEQNHE